MNRSIKYFAVATLIVLSFACSQKQTEKESTQLSNDTQVTAKDILGNPDYQAISYGGYRQNSREIQPTLDQLKDDMRILSAMGIKVLRTYNVQLPHAPNVLKAISELKEEDPDFEMYVMLGAWIDCKNAWTDQAPDHNEESEQNEDEVARVVALANQYPEIVKVLAVGNEAMVRWATSYFVQPSVVLKWVNHLQSLKTSGGLPMELWITSSDDFASWGGGDLSYRTEELEALIKAVDYVSMHTYPYHNTHYNPEFWRVPAEEGLLPEMQRVDSAMKRSLGFAMAQYDSVKEYVKRIDADKTVHIGETGWASVSDGHYGVGGSRATDEYKQGRYHQQMRDWTNASGISCFYFEAFNEQWKDAGNPNGSENHFGLFDHKGEAKYALWNLVDQGTFAGLTRDGNAIVKTYEGDADALRQEVMTPPSKHESAVQH